MQRRLQILRSANANASDNNRCKGCRVLDLAAIQQASCYIFVLTKKVICVIIRLFKICTFTVSFWLATSQSWFVVREREKGGFGGAAAAAESPQRLFHSDPVTPLHSYSYCPTLEGIIFKRCNKKQPVCLSPKPPSRWSPCLSHRRSHRLPAAGVSLDVNGGKICWVRFSPGFTLLPVFNIWSVQTKRVFWDFSFQYFLSISVFTRIHVARLWQPSHSGAK